MGYIGVNPENQDYFHQRVLEAKIKDYFCPISKEGYWETVDQYWDKIVNILSQFLGSASVSHATILKESKNPRLAEYFQAAWFAAPDDGKIHLIPAWEILCDLCSESYLIFDEQN